MASNREYNRQVNPTDLLRLAKNRLDTLTLERLKVADDFLSYLEERESDEATAELLALPGFLDALSKSEEEITADRLTSVDNLRRKD